MYFQMSCTFTDQCTTITFRKVKPSLYFLLKYSGGNAVDVSNCTYILPIFGWHWLTEMYLKTEQLMILVVFYSNCRWVGLHPSLWCDFKCNKAAHRSSLPVDHHDMSQLIPTWLLDPSLLPPPTPFRHSSLQSEILDAEKLGSWDLRNSQRRDLGCAPFVSLYKSALCPGEEKV